MQTKFKNIINFLLTLYTIINCLTPRGQNYKKKLYGPFLWIGFNCLKASATSRTQFTFYHYVPRYSWYSIYQPRKDETLSQPWSHPEVLNTGPLDWKSSALTTRTSLSTLWCCLFWPSLFWVALNLARNEAWVVRNIIPCIQVKTKEG